MDINYYGELPRESCVMAACDSKYFLEHGLAFVKSASDNNKHVHIHIINPTEEVFSFGCILQGLAKTKVTYTYNDFEFTEQWTDENKRTLYACLRFLIAPVMLQAVKEKLTILDIDSIIMSDFKTPMTKRVGYFPREPLPGTVGWEAEGTKVAAGIIFYKKNKMTLDIAREVAAKIRELPMQWFVDQIALNKVFTMVKERDPHILYEFDSKFMDWEFIEGTSIWTGKGPRKYDNPTYVAKKKSYDSEIEKIKEYDNIILSPRLDLPFKKALGKEKDSMTDPWVRKYWQDYGDKKERELENNFRITSPRWMFNNTILKYFKDNSTIYCPHVEKKQWGGDDRCIYYMQTVFPWMMTEDTEGWAGGAKYIETFDPNAEYSEEAFDKLSKYSKNGNSKFPQPKERLEMIRGKTAGIPFILVPMQLPHDETIKWHSDVGVWQMAIALAEWAENTPDAPHVVFKFHPLQTPDENFNKFGERLANMEKVAFRLGREISIHQLFEECEAVYVINSGTGQEAMLWDLPVVTFGRADYTPACIKGNLNDLDFVWEAVKHDDHESRKRQYRRWYDWYVNKICINVKEDK